MAQFNLKTATKLCVQFFCVDEILLVLIFYTLLISLSTCNVTLDFRYAVSVVWGSPTGVYSAITFRMSDQIAERVTIAASPVFWLIVKCIVDETSNRVNVHCGSLVDTRSDVVLASSRESENNGVKQCIDGSINCVTTTIDPHIGGIGGEGAQCHKRSTCEITMEPRAIA